MILGYLNIGDKFLCNLSLRGVYFEGTIIGKKNETTVVCDSKTRFEFELNNSVEVCEEK